MITQATEATVLFRLVYEAMRRAQLPADEILQRVGVETERLENKSRMPLRGQVAFWRAAEDITGDHDIGLHLGAHLPVYRGQVLEYLFTSSHSFGEGLERILSYQRLVSDALAVKLVRTEDAHGNPACYFSHTEPDLGNIEDVRRHFIECLLMGVLRFFKGLTEGQFRFTRIELDYLHGADLSEYKQLFGCDVVLGAPEIRVYFPYDMLQFKLWHSEPELLRFHEQMANVKLQELARFDLVSDIRRAIASSLERSEVTLESVAKELGIEPRRLRTLLSEADTSFKRILTDYRCRLSKRLLRDTNESIENIVYLTGFSEPSTFYRAFKRWTGETPVEFRNSHRRDGK